MRIIQGDITKVQADAIVNAANIELVGGGGVDGAIRRAGGNGLARALDRMSKDGGLRFVGNALATLGFSLPCEVIIHTAAPIRVRGDEWQEMQLADCYDNCCTLALNIGCRSIAFPLLGTGAYGWPMELGKQIAEEALRRYDDELEITLVEYAAG